jgi:hypothetical protein
MTCWAVLVSKESASELFQPGVTLTTELLTKRASHRAHALHEHSHRGRGTPLPSAQQRERRSAAHAHEQRVAACRVRSVASEMQRE